MHYYKRNLGDYAKKAGRLSMLQHGAYTLLIDACYDREQFPTMQDAIDWTWASSAAEIEAVEFVLRKFFVLTDGVYVQNRIQQEIAAYRAVSETNARIARERETKRASSCTERTRSVNDASRSENEAPPNHKPITINQEYPHTPSVAGGHVDQKKPSAVSLETWLENIKSKGEQPIPPTDPVFAYAEQAGIPMEHMRLAWAEFRARYTEPGAKRYRDWRTVYRKAVRGNWFKLWFCTADGEYALTTTGTQALRTMQAKQAAREGVEA